jgi:hypothetical protein
VQGTSEALLGWNAAERGEPLDESKSPEWQAGHNLWHSREQCRRRWAKYADMSAALH